MKALKILAVALLAYVGIDPDGAAHDRVVSRLESDGRLYVAANHWPRAWYDRALENPDVAITRNGERSEHRAVPVTGC